MKISNEQFLKAIFSKDYENVHVTDFIYDPNNIPKDEHLISWKGGLFKNYIFKEESNQYFTISLFNRDDKNTPRRRKALFIQTNVIVLDDVKEKLSMSEVSKLPKPSYILETSEGSEQWGYVLNEPCTKRSKVENLLDGLVANGLAPEGKDPGMKGVTRYVRLPGGYNTKRNKLIEGKPFKCRITLWNPFNTVTLEELAKPFSVNLNAARREERLDGASNIPDHPLLHCGLNIKEIRSDGRFDITCPWVDEHTGSVDNGSGIFTNEDGSIGFKCHHGACESRTAKDLLIYLENKSPGFIHTYKEWQFNHVFKDLIKPSLVSQESRINVDFMSSPGNPGKNNKNVSSRDEILNRIIHLEKGCQEQRDLISEFLKLIESISEIDKNYYHQEISDVMGWGKGEFQKILKGLQNEWYQKKESIFYDSIVFIKEQNRFYDYKTGLFYTTDCFQNSFAHEDNEAKKEALMNGRVEKVDKMDFSPKKPRIYEEGGIRFANSWNAKKEIVGVQGDASFWLNHWDKMGWGPNRNHMLKYMAYTILYPENKINHMLLLGGMEGTGKDFLLYPFLKAMDTYATVIDGHELLNNFNDYLLNTKYLHINETELGDHNQATEISNKLKPLAAAPPNTLRVNQKGITPIKIRNIVNLTMTTNSQMPVKLSGPSRRFYAVWTDLQVRDNDEEMLPEWAEYWNIRWPWMLNEGADYCIWYLRNCVDLSNFNPGEAPKMTEFLKNIRESSKSPAQQTLESFIENKIGLFKNDLLTANDICAALKSGALMFDDYMYIQASWFTPSKVGRILKDIPGCVKLRARGEIEIKPWAIRNRLKYEGLGYEQIYAEYLRQKGENK